MKKSILKIDGIARRIRSDEVNIWYASPKEASESNYEEWIHNEKAWAASFNIPIENLFIFEQGGKFPGKLCFIEEDNEHILFAMPAIKMCPECKNIAINLFQLAISEAKTRNVHRLDTFLDDCNEPLIKIFEKNGCEKIIKRMELVYQI